MNLLNKNSSYMIISAYSNVNDAAINDTMNSELKDILYRKEYNILEFNNSNTASFLAFKDGDISESNNNNRLRCEAIELIDIFNINSIIIKYKGELLPLTLKNNGYESPVKITKYNGISENSYFNEKTMFSVEYIDEYRLITKKSDLKPNMIVEIMKNDGNWMPLLLNDINTQWDKSIKIMTKYKKARVKVNFKELL